MNSLIQELTSELKSNPAINNSIMVRMVLESINNSMLLGVPADQVMESALTNLSEMATATLNENLKEVVAKFMKMSEKPTKRLQDMAKEAGLSMKIKALKESALYKDPTFKYTLSVLEQKLAISPEFRVIGALIESLSGFSYDSLVESTITELSDYINENRAKLEVINAIFEMRQTGAVLYREAISELETCLLEGTFTADTIRMKLRGKSSLPILTRLVNTLSMVEAKQSGKFSIGIGNGDAKVKSVIAPFQKISESEAVVFVDNKFIKLSDYSEPTEATEEEMIGYPEFTEICETFASLNFKERESEIYSKGRNLEVALAVNEDATLSLKINGSVVEDLTKVQLTELFLLEQNSTRASLTKLFNNIDMIVNLEFAKRLVNERLNSDSIVFTIGETLYVFEKYAHTRVLKKMAGLEFHNYVMEKFNYDVSELYAIELEEREAYLRQIEEDKKAVERDLTKLEETIAQLDEAIGDAEVSEEYHTQLADLRIAIEKNVNTLKNHYIELEQSKKKD